MEYYILRELSEMARIPLHIARRDAKLLFPEKQSQGISSTYNTNECFELYLYAHLVGVKKMAIEEAHRVIKTLRPYLRKKGLIPEGKKPVADDYRDIKGEDELGQYYEIKDAPIVYPTKIAIFAAIIHDQEGNPSSDFNIVATREDVKKHKMSDDGSSHEADIKRITEYIYSPPDGYEIDNTDETILPISLLLDRFKKNKRHYDYSH